MSSNCHQSSTQTGSPRTCLAPSATWHRSKAKFIYQNLRDTSCSRLQLKKYQQKATPSIGQKSCKSAKCHQKTPLRITVSDHSYCCLRVANLNVRLLMFVYHQHVNHLTTFFSHILAQASYHSMLSRYLYILYCSIFKPVVGIKQTCLFSRCGVVLEEYIIVHVIFLSVIILKFSAKENKKMQELNIATLKK